MDFSGKTAMVTGAGRNMGKGIAMAFAKAGAMVLVCDLDFESAESTAKEICSLGGKAMPFAFDVRDRKKIFEAVEAAEKELGGVDILVNNAGGSASLLGKLTDFVDAEESTIDFVLDVNLKGSINCIQAVLPGMIRRQWGRIISISSIAGICGIKKRCDYAAAKAGIVGLSKSLAMEVGADGITVNCISPGAIQRGDKPHPGHWTYIGKNGREGKPSEIAEAVLFLAGQSYITGENLVVDGGRILGPKSL